MPGGPKASALYLASLAWRGRVNLLTGLNLLLQCLLPCVKVWEHSLVSPRMVLIWLGVNIPSTWPPSVCFWWCMPWVMSSLRFHFEPPLFSQFAPSSSSLQDMQHRVPPARRQSQPSSPGPSPWWHCSSNAPVAAKSCCMGCPLLSPATLLCTGFCHCNWHLHLHCLRL